MIDIFDESAIGFSWHYGHETS